MGSGKYIYFYLFILIYIVYLYGNQIIITMTTVEFKKLSSEYNKLNKEYMSLDKANEKETNDSILFANYDRMDAIQKEMQIISNLQGYD